MFCQRCGTNNGNFSAFCARCGSPLKLPHTPPVQPPIQPPLTPPVPYTVPVAPPRPSNPGKGLGIAGMVLGILSVLFLLASCNPYALLITLPCSFVLALVGLILSICGKSNSSHANFSNGFANAGLICACLSIGVPLLLLAFFLVLVIVVFLIGTISETSSLTL